MVLAGIAGIAGSSVLYLVPPQRKSTQTPATAPASTTVTQAEPTVFSVTVFVAGVVLILTAANGRKIVRLSREGADFDTPTEDQVTADVERLKDQINEDKEAPVTPAKPEKTFTRDGYEYQVFEAQDVPLEVLAAVSRAEPKLVEAVTDVDYAFRRTGKGNHTWFLKAKSGDTLAVSFGGRGKAAATVAKPESK